MGHCYVSLLSKDDLKWSTTEPKNPENQWKMKKTHRKKFNKTIFKIILHRTKILMRALKIERVEILIKKNKYFSRLRLN